MKPRRTSLPTASILNGLKLALLLPGLQPTSIRTGRKPASLPTGINPASPESLRTCSQLPSTRTCLFWAGMSAALFQFHREITLFRTITKPASPNSNLKPRLIKPANGFFHLDLYENRCRKVVTFVTSARRIYRSLFTTECAQM